MNVVFAYDNTEDEKETDLLRDLRNMLDMHGVGNSIEIENMQMFCPICHKVGSLDNPDENPYLATDDYITHPMIWCCCKSVLLSNTAKIVPADEISQEYKNEVANLDSTVFFTVKLALIKKIVDNNLGRFECDVSIPDSDARKFSDAFYESTLTHREFVETNEIAKKYDIRLRDGHIDDMKESVSDYDDNADSKFINAKTLNIGIKVNSYDILNPVLSYPRSTNLQHDDTVIRLLCADENGEEFCANFWGV